MRTRLFIFLLFSIGLFACNTQRHAQHRIRRITEQCPELVAIQAHPIDTFLPVPSLADTAIMPLAPILEGQTVTVTTDQGTFTASAVNDSLTVTYEAEPEPIHYEDTLLFASGYRGTVSKQGTTQLRVVSAGHGDHSIGHRYHNNHCHSKKGESFLILYREAFPDSEPSVGQRLRSSVVSFWWQ